MEILKIDGAFGEGGGQIVRSAITLSCITKTPIQIENIRKNRKVPGLRAQHLTAIKILSKICNANVEGLKIGSTNIKFLPNEVTSCSLNENIGTAGSISLLLQVLIPAVSICQKKLSLTIGGGTDVAWSPTAYYTKYVLSEAYSRMGINFSIKIIKRGYYPKGGGIIDLQVYPSKKLEPVLLHKRQTKNAKLFCTFSKISKDVIASKINSMIDYLERNRFLVNSKINNENTFDIGSSLLVSSIDSTSIMGVDGIIDTKKKDFQKSIPIDFVNNDLGVDEHLADMLVLPSSVVKGMSIFRVKKITKHLETNLYVTSKITGCKYGIGETDDGFEIRIAGNSDASV